MRTSYDRGFGLTAIIIVFAVVILGAGGAYFYVEQEKKVEITLPEVSEEKNEEAKRSGEGSVVETEPKKSLDELPIEQKIRSSDTPTQKISTSGEKVAPNLSVTFNPSGSLEGDIFCEAGSPRKVTTFTIFTGDGGRYSNPSLVHNNSLTISHTYLKPGFYNITCVPEYESAVITADSPYAATAHDVRVGDTTGISSNLYKDSVAKIKPIDSDPEVVSAVESYNAINSARTFSEAEQYFILEDPTKEFSFIDDWSTEDFILVGYSKEVKEDYEDVVILWVRSAGEFDLQPMVFEEEGNRWKFSSSATLYFTLNLFIF